MATLVDLENLQKIQEDREEALASLRKIWAKMAGTDAQKVSGAIDEAVRATRKAKK